MRGYLVAIVGVLLSTTASANPQNYYFRDLARQLRAADAKAFFIGDGPEPAIIKRFASEGEPALKFLMRQSKDPVMAPRISWVLKESKDLARPYVGFLTNELDSKSATRRAAAVRALWSLHESSPYICRAIMRSFRTLGSTTILGMFMLYRCSPKIQAKLYEELKRCIKKSCTRSYETVIVGHRMLHLRPKQAVRDLVRIVRRSKNKEARKAIVRLATSDYRSADPEHPAFTKTVFGLALKDRSPEVRQIAKDALASAPKATTAKAAP